MTSQFLPRLGIGLGLLVACVVLHAVLLSYLVRRARIWEAAASLGRTYAVWVLLRVALWMVAAHMVEMVLWAASYVWFGVLPNFEDAMYFSMVTYTTVGYGDVLLPRGWHIVSGLEGLTGIMMVGWSTAFLFVVVNRLILRREPDPPTSPTPS